MNIKKPVKIIIGVLTVFAVLFPLLIAPAFVMYFMFSSGFPFNFIDSGSNLLEFEKTFFPTMMVFYPAMLCFSLVQLGLQVVYIIHAIKNKAFTDTFRILFVIGIFFLPYISMPIYFVAYLWKNQDQEATTIQPQAVQ